MYQRTKIQEESLFYESLNHSGELPIIGVNTFLNPEDASTRVPHEVRRSTEEEKDYAILSRQAFSERNEPEGQAALKHLQKVAIEEGNIFEALMEVGKICSLGEISKALYEVGGQYRRNM
jgi:methylmalonyl-CoA mutase